ncbi:MAG: lysylphosphatidylglycerol synthase transmembrane domain-containing protein [Candidatus Saccharibacteria bacterium]|nr:lysylphosphatidylglycerol synthase transmembrane domain-containing protein [Candidatus Saccharibacteria bacterium]
MAKKKRIGFSFKTILIILTAVLVGYVIYQNWPDILDTLNHLQDTNVIVLLLLIPEQLFMYYACGQIFFSYLRHQRNVQKFGRKEVLRISTELNFVNHAIPAGGVGGLAFLTYRLKPFGVSAGQSSFLYIFRYAITTVINYLQALVAIAVLLALGLIPNEAMWIIPVALLMNLGVGFALFLIIYIAGNGKRISFFAKLVEGVTGRLAWVFTFGRKKRMVRDEKISEYFEDIHQSLKIAKENKQYLKKPALWGLTYSLLEIGTYWIVAISLGRPELLPYIMIGEAIGSVFDGIVPYGLYELGMAGVMIALGVDFPTATIVTVMTRVITLVFTIASGSVPYYKAIRSKTK